MDRGAAAGREPPRQPLEQLQKRLGRVAAGVVDLERNWLLAQTLAEAGKLMSLIRDLDAVLEVYADLAVRALGADRGYVLLAEEDGRSRCASPATWARACAASPATSPPTS